MIKYTVKVDGMMCGMCENHVNEAVRKAMTVKHVASSHSKGETTVIVDDEIDENTLVKAIADTGYEVKGVSHAPYKKKLFGW